MSRVCNICGKGQASGNNVSHSNRKTRRTFKVNVQKISYVEDGKETNGYVCARCIKTLKKAGANVIVAGSTVFNAQDRSAIIATLKK